MGWVLVKILQDYVSPPNKEHVEILVSGDEPEIKQKLTYSQILTGGQIRSADGS